MNRALVLCRVATTALVVFLSACGAKTGLREPCVLPLRGTTPAFVLGYETSNTTIVTLFPDSGSRQNPNYLDYIRHTTVLLPHFEADTMIGSIAGPVESRTMPGIYCPNPTSMNQPIVRNNANAILTEMRETTTEFSRPGNAVTGLLNVAAQALRELPAEYDPRIIVFMNTAGTACLDPPNDLLTHIRPIAALAASGIRTLLISERNPISFGAQPNLMAVAGGLPRDDPAERFYGADDPAPVLERLEQVLFEPAYCQLRVEGTPRGVSGCQR